MVKKETNFNNSFEVEKFIQNLSKQILKNYPASIQNLSSIISGRAGTHNCYRNNYFKLQDDGFFNNGNTSTVNATEILQCSRRCKLTSYLKAMLLLITIVTNCLPQIKLKNKSIPNILIYSTPSEKINNKAIYDFFVEPRIMSHLQCGEPQIVIQKKPNFKTKNYHPKIISTRYIPLYLLRNHLSLRHKIEIQKVVLKNFFKFKSTYSCDPFLLCQKELIFEIPLYTRINLSNKTDVIYTQSNLRVLSPISYITEVNYKVKNIMIWYSTNSDLIYKKYDKSFKIENNYLSLGRINCHLVWDRAAKIKLSKMTKSDIFICGSLLFYPREKSFKQKKNKIFNILFFDITPLEAATKNDFLNTDQALMTIQEILNVTAEIKSNLKLDIQLSIKPKRNYSSLHSQKYLNYLKYLQTQKKILIIKNSSNLYKAVQESDLVICVPWTSPALIAKELGVNAIYYVSDRDYAWKLRQTRDVTLIRDEKNLYLFVKKLISSKF